MALQLGVVEGHYPLTYLIAQHKKEKKRRWEVFRDKTLVGVAGQRGRFSGEQDILILIHFQCSAD